jgi:hypothetical protein
VTYRIGPLTDGAVEELIIGGQIRHDLSGLLGLKDEDETTRDTTPSLPGMP